MEYRELITRVYTARHEVMKYGGTDTESWKVFVSVEDFSALKIDPAVLEFTRYESVCHTMTALGIPVRPDRDLRPGEVRIRAEVAA